MNGTTLVLVGQSYEEETLMAFNMNELIKYLSITMAVALISSTSSAITREAKLITSPEGKFVYNAILDHKEEIVFEQNSANVTFLQQKVNETNKRSGKKITANKVPGKDASGFSELIMKKIDDKNVTIEINRREYPEKNLRIDLHYQITGKFAKGTWTDLLADKDVNIILSLDSKRTSQSQLRPYMAKVIKSIGDEQHPLGRFKGIELTEENFVFDLKSISGKKKAMIQTFDISTKFKLF